MRETKIIRFPFVLFIKVKFKNILFVIRLIPLLEEVKQNVSNHFCIIWKAKYLNQSILYHAAKRVKLFDNPLINA